MFGRSERFSASSPLAVILTLHSRGAVAAVCLCERRRQEYLLSPARTSWLLLKEEMPGYLGLGKGSTKLSPNCIVQIRCDVRTRTLLLQSSFLQGCLHAVDQVDGERILPDALKFRQGGQFEDPPGADNLLEIFTFHKDQRTSFTLLESTVVYIKKFLT